MATRNFWIEAQIDGLKTHLEGGPQSKDGGFELVICMRDQGSVKRALIIQGWSDGRTIQLQTINGENGVIDFSMMTER